MYSLVVQSVDIEEDELFDNMLQDDDRDLKMKILDNINAE